MPMTDDELRDTMNARMSPSARLLGMELLEVDSKAGRVLMRFQPKPEFCNPMGTVQGGFVAAMLDDAAAYAAIIHSGERIAVPTIELKVSFFAAARAGKPLMVEGRCLKLGKRVAFMEADMRDSEGKLLARLTTSASPMKMGDANLVPPAGAAPGTGSLGDTI
ncbi:MAG: PaaI family thioesterase [Polymorphobacter sp.]